MNYYVIGDEDTVLGFGMVGVKGTAVHTREETEAAFKAAISEQETGIIIITERMAELIRPLVDRYLFTERFPLIVEIADRQGPVEGRPSIREMVNIAIGIKL
jgi:V/A-type H+-transporting ATPase subunit F